MVARSKAKRSAERSTKGSQPRPGNGALPAWAATGQTTPWSNPGLFSGIAPAAPSGSPSASRGPPTVSGRSRVCGGGLPVSRRISIGSGCAASFAAARPYLCQVRQFLIILGIILVVAGVAWPWLGRIGLGHLPGDISVQRPGFRFYAPLGSSLLVSIVLSVVLSLILWFWRR